MTLFPCSKWSSCSLTPHACSVRYFKAHQANKGHWAKNAYEQVIETSIPLCISCEIGAQNLKDQTGEWIEPIRSKPKKIKVALPKGTFQARLNASLCTHKYTDVFSALKDLIGKQGKSTLQVGAILNVSPYWVFKTAKKLKIETLGRGRRRYTSRDDNAITAHNTENKESGERGYEIRSSPKSEG